MNLIKAAIQAAGGGLAVEALGAATKVLGLAPDTPKEEVIERLENSTPEEREALAKIEARVAERTLELDHKNTQDARESYSENKDWIAGLTAATVAIAFLGTIGVILYAILTEVVIDGTFEILLTTILSYLAGMLSTKVNFFWGAAKTGGKK